MWNKVAVKHVNPAIVITERHQRSKDKAVCDLLDLRLLWFNMHVLTHSQTTHCVVLYHELIAVYLQFWQGSWTFYGSCSLKHTFFGLQDSLC